MTAETFVECFECVCYWVKPFINIISCNLLEHYICCYSYLIYEKQSSGSLLSQVIHSWQWIQETTSDSLVAEPSLLSYDVDLKIKVQQS